MTQRDLRTPHRLLPEQLRWACDPKTFPFKTTAELKADEVIVGQDRAVRALELALTIQQPGYNVYISGPVGTGRTTYARKKVQAVAAAKPAPPDWCYVYNFQQPDQPAALSPPSGSGVKFRKDIDELMDELKDAIRKVFASETFETRRRELVQSFEQRIADVWQELETKADGAGRSLWRADHPGAVQPAPGGAAERDHPPRPRAARGSGRSGAQGPDHRA
ncbi:MAG: hypothetical protein E6H01_04005 [Bacillati bacterium ANGP1]|uniref:Lon-like helical domain-containing protein n=1 Tax=Candidatus Segetimicrobium genomatis TaxID=2569760 RepID=A0A537L9J4_9BACT|nr:MAG: hypothetical protein E6H01_04005 [Terrabacteria group bacterium ANGP1]